MKSGLGPNFVVDTAQARNGEGLFIGFFAQSRARDGSDPA